MLATCICLNGSLLDQLSCTIVYLHNLFTCTFGRINMSVCLSVCLFCLGLIFCYVSWAMLLFSMLSYYSGGLILCSLSWAIILFCLGLCRRAVDRARYGEYGGRTVPKA